MCMFVCMRKPTYEQTVARLKELGYPVLPFMGVNIRRSFNDVNKFDDLLGYLHDGKVTWHTGTTDPGRYHLLYPENVNGVAILCPGFYKDCWTMGKHRGEYDAWVQIAPVKVWRDKDKDAIIEYSVEVFEDARGINQHRANANAVSQNVEKWSAGCQVRNNPVEYEEFIKASSESGLTKYSLALLDQWLF